MAKKIKFESTGGKLWVKIEMYGIYTISYTYQLWAIDPNDPPILTNPIKHGSNDIPHDDHYQIINDFNTEEAVSKNNGRTIDVRFRLVKVIEDNGYHLKATVSQGNSFEASIVLGSDEVFGSMGAISLKDEFILINLTA